MKSRRLVQFHWLAAALAMLAAGAATAADFPTRPVRMVLSYPPGSLDVLARGIAAGMSSKLKQPVVVENKPGANTLIATQAVAQAAADGYTLLYTASPLAQQPVVNKSWNIDPLKDLAPICQTIRQPVYFVISSKKLPVKNLREFIAYAKANPARTNVAMAGTELGYKLFDYIGGTRLELIPYKGESPSLQAVLAGDADMTYSSLFGIQGLVAAGNLRVLGVSSLKRSPQMPDVPTLDEAGLPGYEFGIFHGILGPAGTPRDAIGLLNAAIVETLREPEFTKKLTEQGFFVVADKPEEFARDIANELAMWRKLLAGGVISAQ